MIISSSGKTLLLGIWTGAIGTLAAASTYLISHEQSINVPGEMGEALAGIAIMIFCALFLGSIICATLKWQLKFSIPIILLVILIPVIFISLGSIKTVTTPLLSQKTEIRNSSTSESIRNPAFEDSSKYVLLQGPLFSEATTTLYLHVSGNQFQPPRKITGRYSEDDGKNIGLIVGSYPQNGDFDQIIFSIKPLNYYFHNGGGFATATGTWANDGKEFSGTIQWLNDQKPRSFTLHAVSQESIPGSVPIEFLRIAESWSNTPWIDECEYSIEYPIIDETEDKTIKEMLLDPGSHSFEDQADRFIRTCRLEAPGTGPMGKRTNRAHDISTEIAMNERDILSFFFYISHWEGGAHEGFESRAVTIDMKTGKRLALADLIKPEHLHDFIEYAGEKTLNQEYEALKEAAPPIQSREEFDKLGDFNDLRSFMAKTENLTVAEQIKRYGDFKRFYLTPQGLVIFYNSYDVGMWANTPHVLLPYDQIEDFLQENIKARLLPFLTNDLLQENSVKRINWCGEKDRPQTVPEDGTWISSEYFMGMHHAPTIQHVCRDNQEVFYLQMDWNDDAKSPKGKLFAIFSSSTKAISSPNRDPDLKLLESDKSHPDQIRFSIDGEVHAFNKVNNQFTN